MNRRRLILLRTLFIKFLASFSEFLNYFAFYARSKAKTVSIFFENYKNNLVRLFMAKRGKYNRPFLHIATFGVLGIGVILTPFLAKTYPVFSSNNSITPETGQSITIGDNVFQTSVSQKPRDKTIEYIVQRGDTISTIAEKFGVSEDTVRWENDLTTDNITAGDTLRILPVTGMSYKVQKGDTVYSIAKRFDTDAQKIVDFPFNDFANPETFSLVEGQMLIVPDAIKPSQQPFIHRQVFIAQGPVSISSAGFTWPLHGIITQFASWYHMALDIAAPVGSPIVAAQSGRVSKVSVGTWDYGYGNNVYVDDGAGYSSHYAHLVAVNVNPGEDVVAGKTIIGWVGLTGRTTGPHLHFEVLHNGSLVNPLGYLQ